ncbi:hypothetical protein AB0M97_30695, partial [Streptomyces sp. NPDC051207]
DEGGNVVQKGADGPGDIVDQPDVTPPASGADNPRVDSPVREPALVGAGAATVDNAGQAVRLGSDGLDDVGRVGEDVPTAPAVQAGGDVPTVHAGGDVPGAGAGNNLPRGAADNVRGGSAGDQLPGGSAHDHGPGPSATDETPGGGGGPTEDKGSGVHETPGGAHEQPSSDGQDGPASDAGDRHGASGAAEVTGSSPGNTGPQGGNQPRPVKEWPAGDDIAGPARGKTLLYPNARHDLSGVRNGVPNDKNTVILPEFKENVRQDISEIAAGRADFDPETQRYTVNGRRYAVEPHGRIFPVDGPGFVEMNRVEYSALKAIMRADGDLSKVETMFSKAPQFRENPLSVEKAKELYRKYYG